MSFYRRSSRPMTTREDILKRIELAVREAKEVSREVRGKAPGA